MQIVIEKNLAYNTLALSEIAHALNAEGIKFDVIWDEGRRVCLDVSRADIVHTASRLGLARRCFAVLKIGTLEEVLGFADSIRVDGTFCVRAEHNPELEKTLGAKINGIVSLENPGVLFFVFPRGSNFYFCKKLWEIDNRAYFLREVKNRPFFMPVSIHPKIARAMVNLAEVRAGDCVLDPFCGTGGILIEAGLVGANVIGNDIRKDIIAGARTNLLAYGVQKFELTCGDVGVLSQKLKCVDAIITDPPYGRSATTMGESCDTLLQRAFKVFSELLSTNKHLVIVLPGQPVEQISNFQLIEVHQVYVHKSLTRYICLYRKE